VFRNEIVVSKLSRCSCKGSVVRLHISFSNAKPVFGSIQVSFFRLTTVINERTPNPSPNAATDPAKHRKLQKTCAFKGRQIEVSAEHKNSGRVEWHRRCNRALIPFIHPSLPLCLSLSFSPSLPLFLPVSKPGGRLICILTGAEIL